MFLFVAVATFLAFASSASAGVRGLTTTIESQQSFVGVSDDAVLKVTYTNSSKEDIYLLRWQTALKGLDENIFDVRLDGKPVAYTGRLYKRATPRAEDYVRIPAGGSVSANVELSSAYDLSRTGEYAIRYQVLVQDGLRADNAKISGFAGCATWSRTWCSSESSATSARSAPSRRWSRSTRPSRARRP